MEDHQDGEACGLWRKAERLVCLVLRRGERIGLSSAFSYPMGSYREVRVFHGYTVIQSRGTSYNKGRAGKMLEKNIHSVGG